MIMRRIAIIPFLLISLVTLGQGEGNIWYFGTNGGLDFNSGSPVVLENSVMESFEGSASISDGNGDLLFYTNGEMVYNRNHTIMQNGTGLAGNPGATQSGVIVPKPSSPNQFFVFTVHYSAPYAFKYSIVDMSLNAGLGAVTVKNSPLLENSTEKISAVRHANNEDIWVVVHERNNNTFKSYLVTAAGVSSNAVTSTTGPILGSASANGYLKFSPDGNTLAMATYLDKRLDVFSFNKATGVATFSFSQSFPDATYGVEFTDDASMVYVTVSYNIFEIYQVNLALHSKVKVADAGIAPGALQIAPDGKIYVARYLKPSTCTKYLGVINNPKVSGVGCNYVDEAVYLGSGYSCAGLPTFIQSYFLPRSFNYIDVCYGYPTTFTIINPAGIDSAHWNFGDPASGSNNFARVMTPQHQFTASGTYNVQLTVYDNGVGVNSVQSVEIFALPVVNLGNDQTLCGVSQFVLDAGPGYAEYEWSNGWTGRYFTAVSTGNYAVTVTTSTGCIGSDQISLVFRPAPGIKMIKHN